MKIDGILAQAQEATDAALAQLHALESAAGEARAHLTTALLANQRLAGLSGLDSSALQDFLEKPYLTRPLGGGRYELIVPTFIGFRAGWPVRHQGPYSVFEVSRFIHFLNPLPNWLAAELEFGAPSFKGVLDGNALVVTSGDPAAVAAKLGKAVSRREGNRVYLKPISRFEVLRRIIREEGFLPYSPEPIPPDLLRQPELAKTDSGAPALVLRAHQARDYQRFLETGAVAIFAFPQTGKSFIPLMAAAALKGRKLFLAPRRSLVEQWLARLQLFLTPAAAAEVTVATYQGAAKHLDGDWSLVVFDEAHHLPADFAIESAARLKTASRIGLSATPFREDGNADMIPALCGFPLGADWPISSAQRPPVTVWICRDEDEKLRIMRRLVVKPVDGKTFVFTWRLDIGQRAADSLGAPFVHGKTKNPLQVIDEHELVVISSIGNEGLSFPVRRVVEIDFLYGSGQEAGQRLGRLAYEVTGKEQPGEHHILMTPQEYERHNKRLLVYEQWGLDIDIRSAGGDDVAPRVKVPGQEPGRPARQPALHARPAPTPRPPAPPKAPKPDQPLDEIDQLLALPAIAVKIAKGEEAAPADVRERGLVRRVFRMLSGASYSPEEIVEGLGQSGHNQVGRYRAACRVLAEQGLLRTASDGRYTVNNDEIARLKRLSALKK